MSCKVAVPNPAMSLHGQFVHLFLIEWTIKAFNKLKLVNKYV